MIALPWLKLISPPPENEGEIFVVEFIYRDSLSFSSEEYLRAFLKCQPFQARMYSVNIFSDRYLLSGDCPARLVRFPMCCLPVCLHGQDDSRRRHSDEKDRLSR